MLMRFTLFYVFSISLMPFLIISLLVFMYIYFLRCLFVNSHLLFNNFELQKDMLVRSFYCNQAFLYLYVTKAEKK